VAPRAGPRSAGGSGDRPVRAVAGWAGRSVPWAGGRAVAGPGGPRAPSGVGTVGRRGAPWTAGSAWPPGRRPRRRSERCRRARMVPTPRPAGPRRVRWTRREPPGVRSDGRTPGRPVGQPPEQPVGRRGGRSARRGAPGPASGCRGSRPAGDGEPGREPRPAPRIRGRGCRQPVPRPHPGGSERQPSSPGPSWPGPSWPGPAPRAGRPDGAPRRRPCGGPGRPVRPRSTRSGSSPRCPEKGRGRAPPCWSDRAHGPIRRRGSSSPTLLSVLRVSGPHAGDRALHPRTSGPPLLSGGRWPARAPPGPRPAPCPHRRGRGGRATDQWRRRRRVPGGRGRRPGDGPPGPGRPATPGTARRRVQGRSAPPPASRRLPG